MGAGGGGVRLSCSLNMSAHKCVHFPGKEEGRVANQALINSVYKWL